MPSSTHIDTIQKEIHAGARYRAGKPTDADLYPTGPCMGKYLVKITGKEKEGQQPFTAPPNPRANIL